MLWAVMAPADESPETKLGPAPPDVVLLPGSRSQGGFGENGFIPRSAHFRVTFAFARMRFRREESGPAPGGLSAPGIWQSPSNWEDSPAVTGRWECCCVKRPWGLRDVTVAAARLSLTNAGSAPYSTSLSVIVAPDGALPALAFDRQAFFIEGRPILVATAPSRGAILAESPFAERSMTPQNAAHVESAKGECRGEMLYDLTVPPGQTQTLGFLCPVLLPEAGEVPDLDFYRGLPVDDVFEQAKKEATGQ
jgi:hypothetical protein